MLNIYEISHHDGEKEWCTGATNIAALIAYVAQTECSWSDLEDSEIIELPKEKWKDYTVTGDDSCMTFEEFMQKNKSLGPEIIAGTMY